MWLFKRRPKHISLETLSEFLDGRLNDADVLKVEDHLQTCGSCSEELDSLRDAVGLLRQTPVIPTGRDFTFVEAPESAPEAREPIASGGFPGFRVPVWAYGAAASVAVVAFAITLSIDLTRGPENGDGTVLVSEEGGEFFATTLADPEDLPTGIPMPPSATPAPQEDAASATTIRMRPTSMPEPTPMAMELADPEPQPTQTTEPMMALEVEKVDDEASEPDMAMSSAAESTSGAKVQLTGAPTSTPPPGDVAERRADALTYSPTTI